MIGDQNNCDGEKFTSQIIIEENNKMLSKSERFDSLSLGESESTIVAKLGMPDYIEKYDGNTFLNRLSYIKYKYNEFGVIHFSSRGDKALFVERITPVIKNRYSKETIVEQLKTERVDFLQ